MFIKNPESCKKLSESIKRKYREDLTYRHRAGGQNKGNNLSDETKQKLRLAMIGKKNFLGHKHSPETLLKMRIARLGKPNLSIKGNKHPNWKGGRLTKGQSGYVLIYKPEHPCCIKKGYVWEHKFIMEQKIGRYLNKEEVVHHINGIKWDNRPENLMLFKNSSEHLKFHRNIEKFILTKYAECLQHP